MNLVRPWLAPLMTLVLFGTMVVAPSAMARCEHDCGATHLHLIGADCDKGSGDKICPDACGHESAPAKKFGSGECKPFKSAPVTLAENAPLKTPPPADFIPVVIAVTPVPVREARLIPAANRPHAPPEGPPRETHGRGALPLLI
jgi:hypothetical protein